jgi:preprotein translocase subunit SecY
MFKSYFETLSNCFRIPELRSRIVFTLMLLAVCRMIALTPVPGIKGWELSEHFEEQRAARAAKQQTTGEGGAAGLLDLYSLFTGGALERCAIGTLGIMPYISATIILQLMTAVIPSLSKLKREEGGQTQIIKYGRYLTIILCLGQGYVMSMGWEHPKQIFGGFDGTLVEDPGLWYRVRTALILTTGTALLMWLGEQITERGVGNGVSLVITIGIVARLPQAVQAMWDMFFPSAPWFNWQAMQDARLDSNFNMFHAIILVGLLLGVMAVVISMTQAQRKIPVQYAQRAVGRKMYQGGSSFLPLRVNYAGVMPIIFAQAILMFPQTIFQYLAGLLTQGHFLQKTFSIIAANLAWGSFWFLALEALMILFFSYFWVATQFNEVQIADDLKKYGGYIPGVRPGAPTRDFLHHAMSRITLAGAMFLVGVAILPTILNNQFNVPFAVGSFFGGTSILITVGVMLDTMRQLESHLMMRHYDGFLQKGKIRGR